MQAARLRARGFWSPRQRGSAMAATITEPADPERRSSARCSTWPRQAQKREDADARTDIFAFGGALRNADGP